MATEHSAKHESSVADERTVRSFLEHAAPIILESEELDEKRFHAIRALADEYGLTRDQLACELRLLEQRGVITDAPWDQLENVAGLETEERQTAWGDITVSDQELPRGGTETDSREADGSRGVPDEDSGTELESAPEAQPQPAGIPPASSAMRALQERARKIIARRGILSARTRSKLEKAAKQAGLSESQIASVLDAVPRDDIPDNIPGEPPPTAPDVASHASSAASSSPPSTTHTPSELFRRWIDQKLSGYPSSMLATDDENGLIGVGIHRYHLAPVLATHLVRDVVTERQMRLERDLEDASCNSTVAAGGQASADDQKLQAFFEEVAPILARHRGITPQSRVLLNAVAERLGLSQDELERALATLQQRGTDQPEEDPRQLERIESFRAYLRRAMAHLPNGIVTFKTEKRLCQAGEHFHGVAPQWIKPTIKEVASEIGSRFISKQDAIEHVTELVENQLNARPIIDSATRTRIYAEGTQWGLEPMDIDSILRRRTEMLRRQLASERRRSRWVINFVVGGFAVAAITVLAMVFWDPLNAPISSSNNPSRHRDEPRSAKSRPGAPWWDDNLQISLARLRITRSDLRPVLKDLVSDQSRVRKLAYRQLVGQFTRQLPKRSQRENVRQLLASLYALEPSDAAAHALSDKLFDVFRPLDADVPGPPELIDAMVWNCQVAAATMTHPEISLPRRKYLRQELQERLFTTGDPPLNTKSLERFYVGALAKRLYQQLTRSAARNPKAVGDIFPAVHALARRWLDSPALDQLVVEFLANILPVVQKQKREVNRYGAAIRWISRSSDPNTIIKLLNIYRTTTDDALRNYLIILFYDRLGAAPGTLTEAEMIEQIRESLGIAARERKHQRWNGLAERAEALLNHKDSESTAPEAVLQETIELAHAATLACALTRGEAGEPVFEEMEGEEPPRLRPVSKSADRNRPERYESPYPVSDRAVLEENIRSLDSAVAAVKRVDLLRKVAERTASVPDIDLRSGQRLAEYLVRFKANTHEQQTVLQYAEQLGKWNAVRLGLADQLLESETRGRQLNQLYSRVLDDTVTLATRSDREKVRHRLLAQAANNLSDTPMSGGSRFRVFDNASRALLDLHARQAKLLEVPAERYASASQPSEVIRGLLVHVSERLKDDSFKPEEEALLKSLPYRLKALDFVAENDLQRTAVLQQLWLRILAMRMPQEYPKKATAIRQVLDTTRVMKSEHKQVYEQLRDVQADLLRIWMQLRPQTEDVARPETGV